MSSTTEQPRVFFLCWRSSAYRDRQQHPQNKSGNDRGLRTEGLLLNFLPVLLLADIGKEALQHRVRYESQDEPDWRPGTYDDGVTLIDQPLEDRLERRLVRVYRGVYEAYHTEVSSPAS